MNSINKTIYNTLYQAFKPYLVRIVLLLILGFSGRFLLLYNSKMIATRFDGSVDISHELLVTLIHDLIFILAISFIVTAIYRVVFSRLSAYAVSRIYDETTLRVSRFPLSFFDTQPVGKITARFSSDYGNIFRLFGGPLAEFCSIIFDIFSIVIISITIHPLFIIPMTTALFLFYFILKYNQKELRRSRSEVSLLRAPSVSHFSETVQGATIIKLSKSSQIFSNRFKTLDQIFITAKSSVFKRVFIFSSQLNFMSFVLFLMNGGLSVYLIKKSLIGVGQISIILAYTLLATQALQMFFEWFSQFDEALIGVQRLDEYLRMPIEDNAKLPSNAEFKTGQIQESKADEMKTLPDLHNDLIIENLWLKYQSQDEPTLKSLNIRIQQGQKVGIIGKTGSGKSSLISAIMKLYPYLHGSVSINQNHEMNLEFYRSHFAVVSQDTFFIQGSLKMNIDLFNLYSEELILSTLQQVGIHLPLSFRIEEKGSNLSFGEKQLISLARCLLKNSAFIILDEATANIDPHSEQILTRTFETVLKNKTQIIVAHRLVTIQNCDVLIWLDHGEVKKMGPAKEVLEAFKTSG